MPSSAEDHPRGCGEHSDETSAQVMSTGSSPRMRGAPADGIRLDFASRIIPADAGSTISSEHGRLPGRDHPRGCGEHYENEKRVES